MLSTIFPCYTLHPHDYCVTANLYLSPFTFFTPPSTPFDGDMLAFTFSSLFTCVSCSASYLSACQLFFPPRLRFMTKLLALFLSPSLPSYVTSGCYSLSVSQFSHLYMELLKAHTLKALVKAKWFIFANLPDVCPA